MELSYSHRFIFIHVPRAGGQSVSAALAPYAYVPREYFPRIPVLRKLGDSKMRALRARRWGHIKARELQVELPADVFESFFKFTFVRNPWDLEVSIFHYVRQRVDHPWHEDFKRFGDFDEYLDWRIHEQGVEPQSEFAYGEGGELLVDFVGRFERLPEDFAEVCARVGIECALPHNNRSAHRDFRAYYSPATRALVADAYREDVERFGYAFD